MLVFNKQVAIIGGGPGGLTLARLLQLKGVKVKVFERDLDKNARMIGSPLDLHEESGLAALRKANLMNEFKKSFRPGADRLRIANEHGEILFSDHENKPGEAFGSEHFRPEIDRGPLRNMLLKSLQPGTVVWDSHFLSMERQNDGWLLHFKNGSTVYTDIVIAADGANSRVRPYITDIRAFYSGIVMLEGNVYDAEKAVPHIYALLNGGKLMAFGDSKDLLMGQKGNGEIGFYASFRAEENWLANNGLDYFDNTGLSAWFKKEYYGWSSIWEELWDNAATPFIPRPIYCMPLDQTWEPMANLTMIGDAAHVMPPFAGEGVNMAMLDALELTERLTSDRYNTLWDAISSYEIDMRKRASKATEESLINGERMLSQNALRDMLNFFNYLGA